MQANSISLSMYTSVGNSAFSISAVVFLHLLFYAIIGGAHTNCEIF